VQNSLAATGGDPSMSLLDLFHSAGDPIIEACATQASSAVAAARQEAASADLLRRALAGVGADPDHASSEDMEFALGSLQQNMPQPAFLRLLGHCCSGAAFWVPQSLDVGVWCTEA
jgi:hypothetical protein